MIRRLWTETEPFDFDGRHVYLAGAFANPKPVQEPHPPILIAGRTARVLRLVAEHADVWNIAGYSIDETKPRSALLDRHCAEIGRDPASITRSTSVHVSYEDPTTTQDTVDAVLAAGFTHIVLRPGAPYPDEVACWVAGRSSSPQSAKRAAPCLMRRFCSVARARTTAAWPHFRREEQSARDGASSISASTP